MKAGQARSRYARLRGEDDDMNVWTYHDDGSKGAAEDLQNAYKKLKMATPGITESAPAAADDNMDPNRYYGQGETAPSDPDAPTDW